MMQWIKMLVLAFAAIFGGGVISEIPPFPGWFEIVNANQTSWLTATGSAAVLGFALMMCGTLALLMDQDESLSHVEVEDVERSVHMSAWPVAWRTTWFRVSDRATGCKGSEQFSFREMKQAWRNGAWRRELIWQRRFTSAIGASLLAIGIFGIVFTLGLPPIKAIAGAALLYSCVMLVRGFWRA